MRVEVTSDASPVSTVPKGQGGEGRSVLVLDLCNGKGIHVEELTREIEVASPELAVARGRTLSYFSIQANQPRTEQIFPFRSFTLYSCEFRQGDAKVVPCALVRANTYLGTRFRRQRLPR